MTRTKRLALVALALLASAATLVAQDGTFGGSEDRGSRAPRAWELSITSNVRDADIYIDGVRQRRTTPATFTLRPGSYTVRVEARGYEAWQARIELDSNQTIRADLRPPTATVLLRIADEFLNDFERDPYRLIDIYVDGRLRREARLELEPGYHDIMIVSGGLKIEEELFFEAGRTYTLGLILRMGLIGSGR